MLSDWGYGLQDFGSFPDSLEDVMKPTWYTNHATSNNASHISLDEVLATIQRIEHQTPIIITTRTCIEKLKAKHHDRFQRLTHCGQVSYTRVNGIPIEIYERVADAVQQSVEMSKQGREVIYVYEPLDGGNGNE